MALVGREVRRKNRQQQSYIELLQHKGYEEGATGHLRTSSVGGPRQTLGSTGFSKRSAAKDSYIMALEGYLKEEKAKRSVLEEKLQSPKQEKKIQLSNALLSPKKTTFSKQTPWAGRRQFAEEVTVQLNLQNLQLRGSSFATKFTL